MCLVATPPNAHDNPRPGKREAFQKLIEPFPRETRTLVATAQPLTPDPFRGVNHASHTSMVAVHSEVVEVSDQASLERCVLDLDR